MLDEFESQKVGNLRQLELRPELRTTQEAQLQTLELRGCGEHEQRALEAVVDRSGDEESSRSGDLAYSTSRAGSVGRAHGREAADARPARRVRSPTRSDASGTRLLEMQRGGAGTPSPQFLGRRCPPA